MPEGFEWIVGDDRANSVLAFFRRGAEAGDLVLCIYNLTPAPRASYRVGVPIKGAWNVILDTDAQEFGGSGYRGDGAAVEADAEPSHGRRYSLALDLPPLGALFLEPGG
jgi:1,4-alpha-glucan branching enzyme